MTCAIGKGPDRQPIRPLALKSCSESEVAAEFSPPGRLPAIDLELFGIQLRNGHRRRRVYLLGNVVRTHLQPAGGALVGRVQAIDGKTQVWQYLVINDVVQEYGVRVKNVPVEHDALIE